MTIFKHLRFLSILLITLYDKTNSQDVTEDRKYRCTWHGGSSAARVSCNCESWAEMTLKPGSINSFSTSEILINGCKSIHVEANAVADMRNLRAMSLSNIGSIQFDSDSINWYGYKDNNGIEEERYDITVPSLKFNVYKSNISQISSHTFAGRISEIIFEDVYIHNLQPLAFVNLLQTEKISIRKSVLSNVGVQAFKKFSMEYLELIGVTADEIPSRAFSNITVYQNVTIHNCTFNTIRSGGFTLFNPQSFQVTNNNVRHLNGEAFKIIARGPVLLRNNNFGMVDNGAFRGITLRKDIPLGDSSFIFDSNVLSNLSYGALAVSEPNVQFRNIYLNELCDCTDIDQKIKDNLYYEEIQCRNDDKFITVSYYKSHMCSVASNYYVIIIVVCVVATLIIAIISGLVIYYKFVYKTRKYGNKTDGKNGNLSLIVPDGRTYRETELHVIVERTDLLTTDL